MPVDKVREISGYGVNEAVWGLNVYPTVGTRASLGSPRRCRWTKVPASSCRCRRWFLSTVGFVRIRAWYAHRNLDPTVPPVSRATVEFHAARRRSTVTLVRGECVAPGIAVGQVYLRGL